MLIIKLLRIIWAGWIVAFFGMFSVGFAQTKHRPNIVLIMADDLGFSDLGCYGGEIETPALDGLASGGLRYKQFYNAARCCPSRAALMTGLYPHQAGMGWMAAADMGTAAYQGELNTKSVTIAEVLRSAGYRTYMTGKWHLTNERHIEGQVVDTWPLQRGFDRYFGIIPGGANYFTPTVYSGNTPYPAPDGFYLTEAISDTSVSYIRKHVTTSAETPFFMYVAYTAPHWPLHALEPEIEKYRQRYRQGWDALRVARFHRQQKIGLFGPETVLSPRDTTVPAWDHLSGEKQAEMAERMAIYAAQVDIMDQGIGRIVDELKRQGLYEQTVILFVSDNGACAEFISSGIHKTVNGTDANTFESYRINWANLSSTPFREYKHYTHEGGIATPMIAHWPKGIEKTLHNGFARDYGHLIDIMATCVDLAEATYPDTYNGHEILPMQGRSLLPQFRGASADRRKIFWEHEANIAVRDGRWKMVAKPPIGQAFSRDALELYDMERDPVEATNVAADHQKLLDTLYDAWEDWARDIGALPMDTRDYGERQRDYTRMINGSFDANLGGWKIQGVHPAIGMVSIDTTGQLTGKNAAYIKLYEDGAAPADLVLSWRFYAKQGERFRIGLTCKANNSLSFPVCIYNANDLGTRLLDQRWMATGESTSNAEESNPIPQDGFYRLSVEVGALKEGDECWIDDVILTPIIP